MPGDERETTSLLPLLVTAVISTMALGVVIVATAQGWLGPDVGRAAQFCEIDHWHFLAQPANSLGNLGFVLAGLALAWHARRPENRLTSLGITIALTCVVALLGPASMAMHATNSHAGGVLDVLSMHALAAFATVYALSRLARLDTRRTIIIFVATVGVATRVTHRGEHLEILHHTGNLIFAILLVTALVMEVVLWRRGLTPSLRWAAAALVTMFVAFGIWLISQTGGIWCVPDSWLQGHALWHVLCAAAAYLLGRHYMAVSR